MKPLHNFSIKISETEILMEENLLPRLLHKQNSLKCGCMHLFDSKREWSVDCFGTQLFIMAWQMPPLSWNTPMRSEGIQNAWSQSLFRAFSSNPFLPADHSRRIHTKLAHKHQDMPVLFYCWCYHLEHYSSMTPILLTKYYITWKVSGCEIVFFDVSLTWNGTYVSLT